MPLQTSRSVWTAGACSRFQTRPPHPDRPQFPAPLIHIKPWLFSPLRLHLRPSFPLRSSRETKYRKKRTISDNPAVERFDLVGFAPIAPNCLPKPLPRQGTQYWTAEPQSPPFPI